MDQVVDIAAAVPVSDLELIRAALNSAYHQNTVLDLAEQYRKLQQRPQASKLTQSLQAALTLVISYIEIAESEPAAEESADD